MKYFFFSLLALGCLLSCSKQTPDSNPSGSFINANIDNVAYSSNDIVVVKDTGTNGLGYFYSRTPDSLSIGLMVANGVSAYATGTYSFRPPSPQGVLLSSFVATQVDFLNKLKWTTVQETDLDYFDIQKSADARDFVTIGRIEAIGTTATGGNYDFTDIISGQSGTAFYRLKMVNVDGSVVYSAITVLNNPAVHKAFYSDRDGKYKGFNGTITITSHDINTRSVTGTFSFDVLNNNSQTVRIRNGNFRVIY